MKNALIITYYWPPSGGAGVQRWLKFVRYMNANGYRPVVLTVDPKYATYPLCDESLIAEVPKEVTVFHSKTREPLKFYSSVNKGNIPYGGFANEGKPGLIARFARFIRGNFYVPDARKGWVRYAVAAAEKIIKRESIHVVITTSPPHSTQLTGLQLKERWGIPWLCDLRDPWSDVFYNDAFYRTAAAQKKDSAYERSVLEKADHITVVSRYMKQQFEKKYSDLNGDKISVITNGFDPDDFNRKPQNNGKEFVITYTGTMSPAYPMDAFLDAVRLLHEEDKKIKLRFVGSISEDKDEALKQRGLETITEKTGHIKHRDSVKCMLESTALLLVIPKMAGNEGIVTGKLFEYLAARKPIIGIGPKNGDAAHIIEKCSAGTMFGYSDTNALQEYLRELFGRWADGQLLTAVDETYMDYARDRITGRLCKLLDRL